MHMQIQNVIQQDRTSVYLQNPFAFNFDFLMEELIFKKKIENKTCDERFLEHYTINVVLLQT